MLADNQMKTRIYAVACLVLHLQPNETNQYVQIFDDRHFIEDLNAAHYMAFWCHVQYGTLAVELLTGIDECAQTHLEDDH
jgi:hypothetical protein